MIARALALALVLLAGSAFGAERAPGALYLDPPSRAIPAERASRLVLRFLSGSAPFGHLSGWVTCDRASVVCRAPRLPPRSAPALVARYVHDGPTLWFDLASRPGRPVRGTLDVMAFDVLPRALPGAIARLEIALLDAGTRAGRPYPAARPENAEVVLTPRGVPRPPPGTGAHAGAPLERPEALVRRARWVRAGRPGAVELVVFERGVARRVWVATHAPPE